MAKIEFDGPFTQLKGDGDTKSYGFIATYKLDQEFAPMDGLIPTYVDKVGRVIKYLAVNPEEVMMQENGVTTSKFSFSDANYAYEDDAGKKRFEEWFHKYREIDFICRNNLDAASGKKWMKSIIKKNDPSVYMDELTMKNAFDKVDKDSSVDLSVLIARDTRLCSKSVYGKFNFDYHERIPVPQMSFSDVGELSKKFFVSWIMRLDFKKK